VRKNIFIFRKKKTLQFLSQLIKHNLNHYSHKKYILFRYPCITPRAEFVEAKVYSGTIACARFLYGNRSLVTVGGTDASLMIWELAGKLNHYEFYDNTKNFQLIFLNIK
jgi:hypothetical protein